MTTLCSSSFFSFRASSMSLRGLCPLLDKMGKVGEGEDERELFERTVKGERIAGGGVELVEVGIGGFKRSGSFSSRFSRF